MLVSLPLHDLRDQATTLTAAERSKLDVALKQLVRLRGLVEQLASERRSVAPVPPTPRRADGGTLRREGSGVWTIDPTGPAARGWHRG